MYKRIMIKEERRRDVSLWKLQILVSILLAKGKAVPIVATKLLMETDLSTIDSYAIESAISECCLLHMEDKKILGNILMPLSICTQLRFNLLTILTVLSKTNSNTHTVALSKIDEYVNLLNQKPTDLDSMYSLGIQYMVMMHLLFPEEGKVSIGFLSSEKNIPPAVINKRLYNIVSIYRYEDDIALLELFKSTISIYCTILKILYTASVKEFNPKLQISIFKLMSMKIETVTDVLQWKTKMISLQDRIQKEILLFDPTKLTGEKI